VQASAWFVSLKPDHRFIINLVRQLSRIGLVTSLGIVCHWHLHGMDSMLALCEANPNPPFFTTLPHPHPTFTCWPFCLAMQAPAGCPSDVPSQLLRVCHTSDVDDMDDSRCLSEAVRPPSPM